MGWHGQKRAWAIAKMDQIEALNETIRRLTQEMPLESDTSPF
jgi:hypothetical protein